MFTIRSVSLLSIAVTALLSAGCASMEPGDAQNQYASRDCKAVPATFVDRPKKNATSVEQAEAKLALGRLSAERGGYGGIGNNTLSDLNRDCY